MGTHPLSAPGRVGGTGFIPVGMGGCPLGAVKRMGGVVLFFFPVPKGRFQRYGKGNREIEKILESIKTLINLLLTLHFCAYYLVRK